MATLEERVRTAANCPGLLTKALAEHPYLADYTAALRADLGLVVEAHPDRLFQAAIAAGPILTDWLIDPFTEQL